MRMAMNAVRQMPRRMAALLLALTCVLPAHAAWAAVSVKDDGGHTVTLAAPARRVVSLAPHVTELLFAAGGQGKIVGVSAWSDFPAAARALPQVGDSREIDLERLLSLRPDLLVVWQSGNTTRQLEQLRGLGIPMFMSEPRRLADIPSDVQRLGDLMGTQAVADPAAQAMRQRLANLRARYAGEAPVRVFYQIASKPLYTLNGQHIVSDALRLCGAQNVFADLPVLAPAVTIEAVIQRDPEAIIAGDDDALAMWRAFPALTAVKRGRLLTVDGALLNRAGPRMLDGVDALCRTLDAVRAARDRGKGKR